MEQIFATHLEDWPALLRAMRITADQARAQNRKLMAAESRRRNGGSTAVSVRNSLLTRRALLGTGAALGLTRAVLRAQEPRPTFRVKVDMVVLSFTVTDSKGRYMNGLKPTDFRILEDGIQQKMATFAEGSKPPVQVLEGGATRPLRRRGGGRSQGRDPAPTPLPGTNVFVLFDTSNYMYRGYVYASDAIADFVRGLDRADSVAVYTFCRNLSRAGVLNRERERRLAGCAKPWPATTPRSTTRLLLTLRDAAKVPGRKVVIVFSNGPDNASMVAPDDVRAVAEDEGIPIYVISTSEVNKDPISSGVFRRIAARTGGKASSRQTWQKQVEAFESIREDLGNSYTVTYYPQANPERGLPQDQRRNRLRRGQEVPRQRAAGYRPRGGT